ncbi:hypothetical protein [Streptomyces fuscigenes]|uniref:hypothetical protein n=1 Tax=Streptomyces fuscigenes TaxID=1528880 RepID=UPI001F2E822D|nr:hypothetical protein [Streptomyces fuscigenes]MCF3960301.1 hypothetical protein [Streptomyces fuscigenes]
MFGPYEYRCVKCGETSPEVYSRRELEDVQYAHRMQAHGGLIPDGELVLQPARMSLAELPTEQRVAAVVALALVLALVLFKIM